MHRVQGNKDTARIECVNPVKNKWRIRWDYQQREDGTTDFMEAEFPHKPSVEEVRALVAEAVEKTGAKEPKDMGKVMGALMPKVKGRADGKLVNQLVRAQLAK